MGNGAGFRQDFQNGDGAVGLVDQGMCNSSNGGDGLALSLFNADAYFGMSDQAAGFQHFGNLLFSLNLRQSGDVQANRQEGDANGSGLADTNFPAEHLYIEDFEVQQIAITDDVVTRQHSRGGGHRAK